MSEIAKTLLYWVSNAANNVDEGEAEQSYCLECARKWAGYIIAKAVQS